MRAGGAAAPERDGEDVRDLEQQARERPVRVLRKRPEQPTAAEVHEHEMSVMSRREAGVERVSQAEDVQTPTRGDQGLRRVYPSLELTTDTCGVEHQRRQDAPHEEVYGRPCVYAATLGLATVEVPQIQFIAGVSGHSSCGTETGTLSAWVWRR